MGAMTMMTEGGGREGCAGGGVRIDWAVAGRTHACFPIRLESCVVSAERGQPNLSLV